VRTEQQHTKTTEQVCLAARGETTAEQAQCCWQSELTIFTLRIYPQSIRLQHSAINVCNNVLRESAITRAAICDDVNIIGSDEHQHP